MSPCPFPTTITITPRAPPDEGVNVTLFANAFRKRMDPSVLLQPWQIIGQTKIFSLCRVTGLEIRKLEIQTSCAPLKN